MSFKRDYTGPTSWKSGKNVIQACNSHPGLFTVNYPDGTFAAVNSSHKLMMEKYPINPHGKTKR